MISSSGGSLGPRTESPRDCLLQLNQLVPKTTEAFSKLTSPEREALAVKVTEVLGKVLNNPNSFEPEQQNNLMNIRELAKKAENLGLLEPSKEVMSKIASVAKEKGLSLYTAPRDLTIRTKDGEITVNSDILKENSRVFEKMLTANMREKRENTLSINQYSKQTIELLMSYLHAPSKDQIVFPSHLVTTELLDFAMTYGLDELIKKIEPTISALITTQPQAVLENAQAWLTFLISQKNGSYAPLANKWIAAMTPMLLDHYGIPFKPSSLPDTFEIPSKSVTFFFHEKARDLLQVLPVVIKIKDKKALVRFEKACRLNEEQVFIHIRLHCNQKLSHEEETSLQESLNASNINFSLEKIPIPPGTTLFGKEEWETHFGLIGEAPPLPAGIGELLSSPCPYFPGQTYKDTFMLTLIPATVNGTPLHLNHLRELVKNPKTGHRTDYDYLYQPILDEHGNTAPKSSYWALMSMKELPNSREKSYQEQQALVAVNPSFEVPDLLSGAVCILTHFAKTGVYLFPRGEDLWTYTRCKETVLALDNRRYQTVVGGFGAPGLNIRYHNFGNRTVAVAALRKFF